MPQFLTIDRFEKFENHFDEIITAFTAHIDDRFDQVDKRLDTLEKLFDLERRVELIDERTKRLAEIAGHPELATANF